MCYDRGDTVSRRRNDDANHTATNDAARSDRARDHPGRVRRLGDRGRRLRLGLGAQEDDESIAAIHRALELGVNWIDTAAATASGTPSRSSAARSRASASARTCSRRADSPKGRAGDMHSLRRDSLRRELEGSLTRLGVDAMDLYQIHWPIPAERDRGGLVDARRAEGRGARPPHRRLQLQRRTAAADPADRSGRDAAAALLTGRARGRGASCCRSPSARESA